MPRKRAQILDENVLLRVRALSIDPNLAVVEEFHRLYATRVSRTM
jgi:hypothetical protein